MWKPGSRSSALDRAQAVLSSHKSREAPAARTNSRTAVTDIVFSELSDLSSVNSAPEQKAHLVEPAHEADQKEKGPIKVARPLSSVGQGVNRFLKKTPTAVQHEPKVRNVPSSRQASQTAALSRLAENESHFGKCTQTKSALKQGQIPGRNVILKNSVQSSNEQSLTGKRFLKNKDCVLDDAPPPVAVTPRETTNDGSSHREVQELWSSSQQASDSWEKLHPDPTNADSSSRPSSPFRFTGQARFNHSASSPSHSPPCLSSSPVSTCAQVLSFEKLFFFGAASEDSQNASSVSSGHFRVNMMELDDLGLDNIDFNEDTRGKEPSAFSMERPQQQKAEERKQEEEEELDYQSDFESVGTSAPDSSLSQISEHIQGEGGDPLPSHVSEAQTEYDYSNTFTNTSGTPYSESSDGSRTKQSLSRRSSKPHVSNTSWNQTQKPSARGLRDKAVQTHDGVTSVGPGLETAHHVSPEYVNAHISYSPSTLVLFETLKQQLALTTQFISSSHDLHTRLVQSLEPPNYKYITLEDTLTVTLLANTKRPG